MCKHLSMTLSVLILALAGGSTGLVAAQGLKGNSSSFGTGWQVGSTSPDQASGSPASGGYSAPSTSSSSGSSTYGGSYSGSDQGTGSSYGSSTDTTGSTAQPSTTTPTTTPRTRGNGLRAQ